MTWLERICAVHEGSDRAAVIGEGGSVTGRELIGKSVTAADLLVDLDVQPGQPVPGLLTTNADALALLFGGVAANRPIAPLAPRQTTAELAVTVRRGGSSVLLAEPAFAKTARQVADAVGIKSRGDTCLAGVGAPVAFRTRLDGGLSAYRGNDRCSQGSSVHRASA
jgi:acyl-CoA synthetase (AMP-forming)/AMP-acid ligase II